MVLADCMQALGEIVAWAVRLLFGPGKPPHSGPALKARWKSRTGKLER
jgi:hypothetical protein